jgi:hypothetical protein
MVKASRKKLIFLSVVALVTAAAAVAFPAQLIRDAVCFRFLSPAEKEVVGQWQASMLGGVSTTTIHADHTWTSVGGSCFGDDVRPIAGHWSLDGSDVVFSFASRQFGDWPAPDPQRLPIRRLIDEDRETRLALSNPQK